MNRFSLLVEMYVSSSPPNKEKLARAFQVAATTVDRWITGVAVPHPTLEKKILDWIETDI
jgi:hypothetical protein